MRVGGCLCQAEWTPEVQAKLVKFVQGGAPAQAATTPVEAPAAAAPAEAPAAAAPVEEPAATAPVEDPAAVAALKSLHSNIRWCVGRLLSTA